MMPHGLTAAKMAECRWLKPLLVGEFESAEWTTGEPGHGDGFRMAKDVDKPCIGLPGEQAAYLKTAPRNRCNRSGKNSGAGAAFP
jgi:hypothetical protein